MTIRKWRNETTVNTTTSGSESDPTVAALKDGGYVVGWHDSSVDANRRQVFNADGTLRGTELIGSEGNSNPDFAADASGNYWVGFENNNVGDVDAFVTLLDPTGAAISGFALASTVATAQDQVALSPTAASGFAAVYHDAGVNSGDIFLKTYNAAGAGTLSGPIAVNTITAGDQLNADVEVLSNGNIAAVWNNAGTDIRMRLFNSAGTALLGADVQVDTGEGNSVDSPKIAALNDGRFVVVYTSEAGTSTPDTDLGVRGRIFDAAGSPVGTTFYLNTKISGTQANAAVIGTADGGFVAVWGTIDETNASYQIRGQAYDYSSARSGGEFTVSTQPLDGFGEISLARLGDGRIVVTWQAFFLVGGDAIQSQIIDPRDGLVNGTVGNDALYGHDTLADEINGYIGNDTMFGLGGNDDLRGGTGNDQAYGGRGDDLVYGGSGNDVLGGDQGEDQLFGEDGVDDMRGGAGADDLDGGAGIDIANYSAASVSVTAALDGSLAGAGDALGDTYLNIEDIRGANIAGTGDILRGNSGNNSVTGNAGNDNLNGRAGSDKITGGAGFDTLTGELGNDQFIYNAQAEGGDTVIGFSSAAAGNDDVFKFKGTAFGALPVGNLAANRFQSSASDVAANANVRFFYETDTGILRFDADGSGAVLGPVIVATLTGHPPLAIGDISIF